MPRERRWAKDGPSTRAPGTMMERTNPERSGGPDGGASPFGSFWGAGHPGDCQKEPAQQGGTNASTNPKISSGTNKRRGIALRGYPLYELMFQQTRKRAAARKCQQAARSIRQTPSPLPLSRRERGSREKRALRATLHCCCCVCINAATFTRACICSPPPPRRIPRTGQASR